MKNNKKKIGIIMAIILVIIIITGGVLAFLYLGTDNLKTSKQLFYSYFAQNEEMLGNFDVSKNMMEIENLLKDETYTIDGELTLDYESSSQANKISDVKITVEGKVDNVEKQAYTKLKLMSNAEELFNAEYLKTNDLYALTSNQVVNMYVAVQNNNLKTFAKKLGIQDVSMIPDKLPAVNNEMLSKISVEQIKSILNKYVNLIMEQTSDDNYTKGKGITANINNQDYNDLEVYTLALTKKETVNIAKSLLQNLKEDDKTLNIFLELYKTNKTLDDLNNLKNILQGIINEFDETQLTDELGIKVDVYVKDKKLIGTKIAIPVKMSMNEEIIYEGAFDITITNTDNESKIIFDVTNNDDNFTVDLISNKNNGIIIEFNNQQINLGLTYNQQIKDEKTIAKQIEFYIKQEDILKINYDEEKVITPNLKIDKLEPNTNCVILNDYPQEELQTLMTQLGQRLNQIFVGIDEKIHISDILSVVKITEK